MPIEEISFPKIDLDEIFCHDEKESQIPSHGHHSKSSNESEFITNLNCTRNDIISKRFVRLFKLILIEKFTVMASHNDHCTDELIRHIDHEVNKF